MMLKKMKKRNFLLDDNLSQTDIWRRKSEKKDIIIDPSLFSDP